MGLFRQKKWGQLLLADPSSKSYFLIGGLLGYEIFSLIVQGHPTMVSFQIRRKHFLGCPEYFEISRIAFFVLLQNLYLFGHPRGTWVFSKLQGLRYYFPENVLCNLMCYENENFSDSSLHNIFESETFRFPFCTKNSLTWVVKSEKLNFRKS